MCCYPKKEAEKELGRVTKPPSTEGVLSPDTPVPQALGKRIRSHFLASISLLVEAASWDEAPSFWPPAHMAEFRPC